MTKARNFLYIHVSDCHNQIHVSIDFPILYVPVLFQLIVAIGNENANNFWEFDMLSDMEIEDETSAQQRKHHIEEKYKHRKFCRLHPKNANKTALNQVSETLVAGYQELIKLSFGSMYLIVTTSPWPLILRIVLTQC